jgi:putative DNA methylase
MLEGLIVAGFAVTGTWPMRTERGNRTVAMDTNALASSIVLVCRSRLTDALVATRREFIAALKRELPPALKKLVSAPNRWDAPLMKIGPCEYP